MQELAIYMRPPAGRACHDLWWRERSQGLDDSQIRLRGKCRSVFVEDAKLKGKASQAQVCSATGFDPTHSKFASPGLRSSFPQPLPFSTLGTVSTWANLDRTGQASLLTICIRQVIRLRRMRADIQKCVSEMCQEDHPLPRRWHHEVSRNPLNASD